MKIWNLQKSNQTTFRYPKDYPTKYIALVRAKFAVKKILRWLRIQKLSTMMLGGQYHTSHELIEIDITYQCNLKCNNCNRSSAQAPDNIHINLSQIVNFVEQSLQRKTPWKRIRILGGEPTLHPEFQSIIEQLLVLKTHHPDTVIELVTNGYGRKVNAALENLPEGIWVENSYKTGNVQPSFGPFNMAPQDSVLYKFADYSNGCDIASSCGMGLTPQGYYPCAVAGGIDRVLGLHRGRQSLPSPSDEMRDLMDIACRLCGRFYDGHYVPEKLRPSLEVQKNSRSWDKHYQDWAKRRIDIQ
ncbi:radical SAM protein [Shewanella baltica]|uniref:radical SAM protein n=1 Tax=Shewanella baltica TaxID=62322 RepID=UPI002169CDED|nr:radical SAM protein [Shewanella baltica]